MRGFQGLPSASVIIRTKRTEWVLYRCDPVSDIDIKRIIIDHNQAAVEWYYEDTEKNTGRRNQSDDVIVVDFKDGRISRWREYFDTKTPASR